MPDVYEQRSYAQVPIGFGHRPGIVVVDYQVGFTDPNYAPGFSPYFDTSYVYAPNHGREFYIGFKLDLDTAKNQVVAER